uniref:GG17241 n=1 Tax=Drosophila erecta TaxID=7220 RepID=B3NZI5_DROER
MRLASNGPRTPDSRLPTPRYGIWNTECRVRTEEQGRRATDPDPDTDMDMDPGPF